VCSLGGGGDDVPFAETIAAILAEVKEHPDMPLTIACNAGDVYVYQDPGIAEDTPEGADFNRKRDLDILQRMNWPPGVTLPARTALLYLRAMIPTVEGLCGYDEETSEAWRGCPRAHSGAYERGHALGIEAIIPPRSEEEMSAEKEASIAALEAAEEVPIRPHILLCAVCQYGQGARPPFKADNLPELMQIILHRSPDLRIRMARQADWMMCAPCPARVPGLNACANTLGSGGLSNEKRDLDMLQVLGLEFGSVMPARDLFRLIFERIHTTQDICAREGSCSTSVWWDGCGEKNVTEGNEGYAKGRAEIMDHFGWE
jgi:hypothetical protein